MEKLDDMSEKIEKFTRETKMISLLILKKKIKRKPEDKAIQMIHTKSQVILTMAKKDEAIQMIHTKSQIIILMAKTVIIRLRLEICEAVSP